MHRGQHAGNVAITLQMKTAQNTNRTGFWNNLERDDVASEVENSAEVTINVHERTKHEQPPQL